MSRDDVFGSWSQRFTIGTNTIQEVAAISGQNAISIKLVSGGTLEIGGSTNATGMSGLGQTFGSMYFISSGEVVSLNMSGTFYLWASGATCVAAVLRGRSAGATP